MIPMLFFMYQFYFPTRKVSTVLRNVHCFIHFLFSSLHIAKNNRRNCAQVLRQSL